MGAEQESADLGREIGVRTRGGTGARAQQVPVARLQPTAVRDDGRS
jgi:hypothetical protein